MINIYDNIGAQTGVLQVDSIFTIDWRTSVWVRVMIKEGRSGYGCGSSGKNLGCSCWCWCLESPILSEQTSFEPKFHVLCMRSNEELLQSWFYASSENTIANQYLGSRVKWLVLLVQVISFHLWNSNLLFELTRISLLWFFVTCRSFQIHLLNLKREVLVWYQSNFSFNICVYLEWSPIILTKGTFLTERQLLSYVMVVSCD